MIPLLVAVLVFVSVVSIVVAVAWRRSLRRAVAQRLTGQAPVSPVVLQAATEPESVVVRRLRGTQAYDVLSRLIEQTGNAPSINTVVSLTMASAFLAGAVVWTRTGIMLWSLGAVIAGASIPVLYLMYRRQQRVAKFESQFPDALDMLARSLRAGFALPSSIQVVGDEMPDPVGQEMRRVFEEIRLGGEASDALTKLGRRIPSDDVAFFCAAVRVQRGTGGNIAEVFEKLSDVMRDRFKLLSHARAVSAQQRFGAVCVGVAPLALGLLLRLFNPRYFDPLLESSMGPTLLAAGLLLELVGFFVIWRMARIKV
jgi:tight adherence protein B